MRRASSGSTHEQVPQPSPTRMLTGQPGTNWFPPTARTCTIESPSAYRAAGRGRGLTSTPNINGSPALGSASAPVSTRRSLGVSIRPACNAS